MALDLIFLLNGSEKSLNEFKRHKALFPHAKKFVTKLTGLRAFKAAAKISNTSNFYIVDHGFLLKGTFDVTFKPEEFDQEYIHIWKYLDAETNPKLSEFDGYGGVYLFSKSVLRSIPEDGTLNIEGSLKFIDIVASKPASLDVIMVVDNHKSYGQNFRELAKIVSDFKVVQGKSRKDIYIEAARIAETDCFYVIDGEFAPKDFQFDFRPFVYDYDYVQIFASTTEDDISTRSGIQLFHKQIFETDSLDDADFIFNFGKNVKYLDQVASVLIDRPDHDIVFLSYDEPNAEQNWVKLKQRFPNAKRVHKVKGILNAHKQAAAVAETPNFFVVDGDSDILPTFDFKVAANDFELEHYVHIWKSRNPINGLEYGYGGVKLFHKLMFDDIDSTIVDMSTLLGEGVIIMDEVASITRFNSDWIHTFRAAFRECTKLASGIIRNQDDAESKQRLDIWCTVGEGDYAEFALRGAKLGKEFGSRNSTDVEVLKMINDFEWLDKHAKNNHQIVIPT